MPALLRLASLTQGNESIRPCLSLIRDMFTLTVHLIVRSFFHESQLKVVDVGKTAGLITFIIRLIIGEMVDRINI